MIPELDSDLLRQFVEHRSDAAFAGLVARHVHLVYSVALRQSGDAHHAEEITQAVFTLLSRKARTLRHERALSSWLFRTTRLTANNFLRSELRRRAREQEAYMQSTLNEPAEDTWLQIAPLLDRAVETLGETDRRAILLRFYEGRKLHEVGQALGATEDAAKKRIDRAVEKLRKFFIRRGTSLTATALTAAISANAVQAAPIGFAATISAAATSAGIALQMSSSVSALTKFITMTTLTKTCVATGIIIVLAVGAGPPVLKWTHTHRASAANGQSTSAMLDKEQSVRKKSYAEQFVVGMLMYANSHNNELPTHLEQIADFYGGTENPTLDKLSQFEIVYRGSLSDIQNPARTILVREKNSWQSTPGGWAKTYGFADMHSEVYRSSNGDFESWEKRRMPPTQAAQR